MAAGALARSVARPRRRVRPGRVVRYLVLSAGAVLFVAPFLYMVSSSFQPLSEIFSYPPKWIPTNPTLENYTGFFGSGHQIGRWILNSAFTTATITILQLFFSSLVAYTFAKRTFPGRDFLFFLGLATMMLPAQVTIIPNYLILKGIPLFGGNDLAGVGGHGWLDSFWGIIVPNLVNPFGIFLLRQYMKSIPDELLDAARIDGAGHFKIYWKVILPLSRPALAALAIFTFQFWWGALFWPLIIISSPQLYTLPLGLALFQEQNRTVWNLIMAGSVLAAIPLIAAFLIFQRQFVRGISLSGMKG
ncbi:MAG TPA: carbohydrate ABC transporter permease [Actinomycetes bacterium]|nr:carbohydrate ABC transporter permease [Actinomycetes bacterium]HEV3464477.1 carbohydrate ABC transporter permease [Actinomycetota bacterium]HEX2156239.1 carbohydrate ABC transporter permease [Actinomycetes bacterium]